ncbi:MAG: T9SS type A sorting domain-containing protein [Bacteroidota bacterium]
MSIYQLRLLLCVNLLLAACYTSSAQSGFVAVGASVSNTTGSVSYSVGQIDYISSTNTQGTISQGIQQAHEIFIRSSVSEQPLQTPLSVFPNPAKDHLVLQVGDFTSNPLRYSLMDIQGKELASGVILDYQTHINIADLASAVYSLRVQSDLKGSSTFKIIKIY